MGRVQQVTGALGLVACVALGGGCIHVHRDADGKLKSISANALDAKPAEAKVDPTVTPASATIPAAATTASVASLAKFAGKDVSKGTPTEIALTWQPKVAHLPDPTHNGALIAGVVGQMFLFGPGYQPAQANGKLVIEMFDETGRAGASGDGPRLGGWTFDKDTLRKLITMDERFGKSYALFLPSPDYKPAISRVKLTARFEPERGYPLYAPNSTLTFDTENVGQTTSTRSQTIGGATTGTGAPSGLPSNFGNPSSAGFMGQPASPQTAPVVVPPLNPLPIGGRSATGAPSAPSPSNVPTNLPPLVITAGARP